jgi:4-amino-4-deoxy-L-arabinose transferase-like glycosyltransferase
MGRPSARCCTSAPTALLAVTALAAVFRLYMIDTVPPGLYIDEVLTARHALAWRLAEHKAWFEATPLTGAGWSQIANLYLAGVSAVMWLFGDGFLATRLVSVLPSLVCVPLLYALARAVAGQREALVAALLLAVSHWAARTGRDGWDQVAMTTLQVATLASLAHGLGRDRLPWSWLAGALLGACLYTYVASRLVFVQVGLWLAFELLVSTRRRRTLAHAALCLATAVLCGAPYYIYLVTRSPGGLTARVGGLSLIAPGAAHGVWLTLVENVAAHLAMFNLRGGTYARDNLPGWPMLDPMTGLLFLAGLAVALGRDDRRRRVVITWYAICVLGGVLSQSRDGPPYVYRVANLAPWACLIAAVGAVAAWDHLRPRVSGSVAPFGAAAVLGAAAAFNFWILFVRGPSCPDFSLAFGTAETQLGLWLARHPADRPTYVLYDAMRTLDDYRSSLWYPETNGYNWYAPVDSAAAIHLSADVYRRSPERALDPEALHGDIDLVMHLPESPTRRCLFIVPPTLVEKIARFYAIDGREDLTDSLGRTLGTILRVRPR